MKRIFVILMALCLVIGAICVTAFAADETLPEVASGTVLRITAIEKDGDTVFIADHTSFEDGWNAAMGLANKDTYDRVVVDLYADWIAASNGDFTDDFFNGAGFKWDTIYFNDEVRMTLNMNGHTINRRCPREVENGEVIYIDDDADVIINNGTITGGNSYTGAGGIHMIDDSKLTLNNVHIIGHIVDDSNGAGIAVKDAHLIMNGGSFQNNVAGGESLNVYGGAIYVNDGTAILNGVEFKNNVVKEDNHFGVAIYADDSEVTINECIFDGNGAPDAANGALAATSIIHADDSSITVKKSSFTNNGDMHFEGNSKSGYKNVSALFYLSESTLVMQDDNTVSKNSVCHLFSVKDGSSFFISDTSFSNNNSIVLKSEYHTSDSFFNNCSFNDKKISDYAADRYSFIAYSFITESIITFYDCDMGDSTYSKLKLVKFVNQELETDVVLSISALKADGTVEEIEEYRSFEKGWNAAMTYAFDGSWLRANGYESVVVDMHTDWLALDGKFTKELINDTGFSNDTIFIPEGANVILNMNGHKIDRGISKPQDDGEVIYIMPGADVVINDGTITGGWSTNGGGGIHISGDATVTLNNVHIKGNKVSNDDGSGIAAYDGATLIMNGGSISNNVLSEDGLFISTPYGALYLQDSSAILTDVEITNNGTYMSAFAPWGVALYIRNSSVSMKGCTVTKNGCYDASQGYRTATSVICLDGSSTVLDVTDCKFEDNGTESSPLSYLIQYESGGTVKIKDSAFNNNAAKKLIYTEKGTLEVTNSQFSENKGNIFTGVSAAGSHFTDCSFSGNVTPSNERTFYLNEGCELAFNNCDLNDSTFGHRDRATFDGKAAASIFGEGSFAMIVALLALVASGVSIYLIVDIKKKLVPVAANDAKGNEDEE